MYRLCEDGAVVVRLTRDEEDREAEQRDGKTVLGALCEVARRHKNQVLTVFCLPDGDEQFCRDFLAQLGELAVIELREDAVAPAQAREYLKNLAAQHGLMPDRALCAALGKEKASRTEKELNALFDVWIDHKLRAQVYPQYRAVPSAAALAAAAPPQTGALAQLDGMIGLEQPKEIIHRLLDCFALQHWREQNGLPALYPSMHMVFTGNPGTAKTTTARLFARILKEKGLLQRGELVEVGRADLVGKYVGWTARLVRDKFRQARGGVLFLDEAYALTDGREGSFGDEAINTIVQEMENCREDTAVIFAGYPEKMTAFLDRNPGLRSRIAFTVDFADYDPAQLCAIAEKLADARGLQLSEKARQKLEKIFAAAYKTADFGNGRFVRNLIERAAIEQAGRLAAQGCDAPTAAQLCLLTEADIVAPSGVISSGRARIGFGSGD